MQNLRNLPDTPESLDQYEVEHLFHSWSFQPEKAPARVVSAKGARFTTEDGREILDFSSCFVSHNLGHQDPRVVDAIRRQANTLTSIAPVFSTRPRAMLARLLAEVTPGDLSRSFLTLGGAEANEAAIKIAHQYTGRRKIITQYQSYHGGTTAAMSASAGDARNWAQTQGGAEFVRVPQPYPYRCMFHSATPEECAERHLDYLERVITWEGGGDQIAAMILEPVTGANGILVPPDAYLPGVRALCDRYGILLIADEVMTGFGRTGAWFAVNHWNIVPDIITLAKGINGAYVPLGACVVRKPIGDFFKEHFFSHGATYAGHALGCAAAVEAIACYQDDGLIERAAEMGSYLMTRAQELQERHPCIGEVRGKGLFVGLELVKNRETKEPMVPIGGKTKPGGNPKLAVGRKLFELGMIAMAANPGTVLALAPPLIITRDEIDEGIKKLDIALAEADAFCE
ncbi:MAG: aminotransferase class III-fold pyridoxal phosphate-dependent enzyme [Candidatus Hydrogenedens sp.]|nr:aminotransferase class III-fold pyridoxal phosphate-dependent enzyme [Candidatus Hydrogenedens sp.]